MKRYAVYFEAKVAGDEKAIRKMADAVASVGGNLFHGFGDIYVLEADDFQSAQFELMQASPFGAYHVIFPGQVLAASGPEGFTAVASLFPKEG